MNVLCKECYQDVKIYYTLCQHFLGRVGFITCKCSIGSVMTLAYLKNGAFLALQIFVEQWYKISNHFFIVIIRVKNGCVNNTNKMVGSNTWTFT